MEHEIITFEVREIDALRDDDGWIWNTSYHVGEFTTRAKDGKRAFCAYLKRRGVVFKVNRTLIDYDGDVYEIVDRKTKEPLYAAIPV